MFYTVAIAERTTGGGTTYNYCRKAEEKHNPFHTYEIFLINNFGFLQEQLSRNGSSSNNGSLGNAIGHLLIA
jgi:hypothetical protein